jgi:amino acid transporter
VPAGAAFGRRNYRAPRAVSALLAGEIMTLLRLIIGRPLANRENAERKIGAFAGVPAMGLDGLASVAYGPEAALSVLIPLGAAGTAFLGIVMAPILALLIILYVSYRQTIRAYPVNGGAYSVAKDNLGSNAALLAAAALMIDYILNVAVGISAGVGALVSAVPALHNHVLALCLAVLSLITLVNLRGTRESGLLFALPTYSFVLCFLLLIGWGCWQVGLRGGPAPLVPPPSGTALEPASLWLLVRAFASGCTAMTGIEAVSNAGSAFREPRIIHAHRTLTVIVALLFCLLAGVTYLVVPYHIGAMDETQDGYQSVLSQLAAAVAGRGTAYGIAMASLLCVLVLSANTSFVAFPRLCRLVAQDDFLPRPFAMAGRRLVYWVGVLYLAATAGLLLTLFGGVTDRLIPLFAIGAFLTFTLSQIGMVVHWHREAQGGRDWRARAGHKARFAVNLLGAVATGFALLVMVAAKFADGAWIALLAIPAVIFVLKSINAYYRGLETKLRDDRPMELARHAPPYLLVATQGWNKLTDKAVSFALRLSPDVYALHLTELEGPEGEENLQLLRRQWEVDVEAPAIAAGLKAPRLIFLKAPYRRIHLPLLDFIARLETDDPERPIAILIPTLIKQSWWEMLLHTHRAWQLRRALLRCGDSRIVVIEVPYHLDRPRAAQALAEEVAERVATVRDGRATGA